MNWVDKMCKCDIDPVNIVEDTEHDSDTRHDSVPGRTDSVKPIYPLRLCWSARVCVCKCVCKWVGGWDEGV